MKTINYFCMHVKTVHLNKTKCVFSGINCFHVLHIFQLFKIQISLTLPFNINIKIYSNALHKIMQKLKRVLECQDILHRLVCKFSYIFQCAAHLGAKRGWREQL